MVGSNEHRTFNPRTAMSVSLTMKIVTLGHLEDEYAT